MGSRVLVVQTGFLGDAILATALVERLSGRADVDQVGLVVRSSYADLFEGHRSVDELVGLDKGDPRGFRSSVDAVRTAGYDVALIPHRSLSSSRLAWRGGIPVRIGFRTADAPLLYTDRVEYRTGCREVERNDDLLHAWSGERSPIGSLRTHIPVDTRSADRALVDQLVIPRVAVAFGSVWRTKQWGRENFAALCRKLVQRGIRPVLVGSPAEREEGEWIAREAGLPREDLLAGELSLRELASLLSEVTATVSNDSGGMHLSEGVGTPVVGIFGPTIREFGFSPLLERSSVVEVDGLSCRPCGIHGGQTCPLGHHRCMAGIAVDTVFERIVELVESVGNRIR